MEKHHRITQGLKIEVQNLFGNNNNNNNNNDNT